MGFNSMYSSNYLNNAVVIFLASLLVIVCSEKAFARNSTLSVVLNQIQSELKVIPSEKKSLKQGLSFSENLPHKVTITATTTDLKKGSSIVEQWDLNLSDIDTRLVNYTTSSKSIKLSLKVTDAQKYIKYSKDGDTKGFVNQIELIASDIDNARKLQELLTAAIPEAKKSSKSSIGIDFNNSNQMLKKLSSISLDMQLASKSLIQNIELVDGTSDKLKVVRTETDSKGRKKKIVQIFSLADILVPSVVMKPGKELTVSASTNRGVRLVQVIEDGELKGFSNDIEIYASEIDEARLIQQLVTNLVKPSEKALEARLPAARTRAQLLQTLSKQVIPFNIDDESVDQAMDASCIAHYRRTTTTKSGKTRQEAYEFNFADLREDLVDIKASGKNLDLVLNVHDKQKFIKTFQDDEQKNYDNDFSIPFKDVDSVKAFTHILPKVIKECTTTPVAQSWSWLAKTTADIKQENSAYTQSITKKDANNACKVSFNTSLAKKNTVKENLYEVNLNDLDGKEVSIKVSGTDIAIDLQTNYKEKVIKQYSGTKSGYVSSMSIAVGNLEDARKYKVTMESMISKCKI